MLTLLVSALLFLSSVSLSSAQTTQHYPLGYQFLYDGFSSPYDVATDSSGNIYVADRNTATVFKLNPQANGSPSVYYNNTTPALNQPDGLCLDNSVSPPNVWVADSGNARLLKFSNAGTLLVTVSQYSTPIALAYPWGCAVDSSGNVYISDTSNQTINKVTSAGVFVSNISNSINSIGFQYPNQIALDSSNTYLYVADSNNYLVAKIAVATGLQTQVFRLDTGSFPNGVAVDSQGTVYVTDTGHNRVIVFAPNGTNLFNLTVSNPGFNQPRGIWVDATNNVYVADSGSARIVKFYSITSGFTGSNGGGVPAASSINGYSYSALYNYNGPYDVALDSSNNLYVADTFNARVVKVNSGTNAVLQTFSTTPALTKPEGVCLDSSGNVYIADNAASSPIYKLSPSGTQLLTILGSSATPTLQYIWNCAVDAQGYIYVSNTVGQGVNKFHPNGTQVAFFTVSNPAFQYPNQLALDSQGYIYVADSGNAHVAKIHPNGTQVRPVFNLPAGSSPNGVAVDGSGYVYASDTAQNSVWVFFANGSFAYQFSFPVNAEPLHDPRGLAIDSKGNIYVADSTNNRVVIFTKPTSGSNAASSSAQHSAAALLVVIAFSLALLL